MSVVTITRCKDPLDGQQVRVLGRLRRHGEAELLVVLPDGSKRMIPLSWTDAQPAGECDGAATLGGLGDLLAACVLVAALFYFTGTASSGICFFSLRDALCI